MDSNSSNVISKLKQDIESREKYIDHLSNLLSGYEEEIDSLRRQNTELKIKLQSAIENLTLKEEALLAQDRHILELCEENISLKNRIEELININTEMSHAGSSRNNNLRNLDNNSVLLGRIQDNARTLHRRITLPHAQNLARSNVNSIVTDSNIILNRLNNLQDERDHVILEKDQAILTCDRLRDERTQLAIECERITQERDLAQAGSEIRDILADHLSKIGETEEITDPLETLESCLSRLRELEFHLPEIRQARDEAEDNLEKCKTYEDEINRIVDERLTAKQKITAPKVDTRGFSLLENIAMRLGYSDEASRNADAMYDFIEKEIAPLGHVTFYVKTSNNKPRRTHKATKKYTKKSGATGGKKRHCSNCGRVGHTKNRCTGMDDQTDSESESESEGSCSSSDDETICHRGSRNDESESETESETGSDYDSEQSSKNSNGKTTTKTGGKKTKSVSPKRSKKIVDTGTQIIFRESVKIIIRSLVAECPKELIQAIFQHMNKVFQESKIPLLDQFVENLSSEAKEEIWKHVTEIYNDILLPLIEAVYQVQINLIRNNSTRVDTFPRFGSINNREKMSVLPVPLERCESIGQNILALNQAILDYQSHQKVHETTDESQITHLCRSSNIFCPKPFELNFVRKNIPNDVATISCKIGGLLIPYAIVDTGSDSSIMSENIARNIGKAIDENTAQEITGVASSTRTIGTIYDVPISIGYGDNKLLINDDFLVVETEKDKNGKDKSLLILGVTWLHRARWSPIINVNCSLDPSPAPLSNEVEDENCDTCVDCGHFSLIEDLKMELVDLKAKFELAVDYGLIIANRYAQLKDHVSVDEIDDINT
ncbi:hypothetical protein C1645_742766 [Glomus cerebriforme]|uniref:CCHC-type domain-containing protein n=1 Tax=Glomus cerebriforme TaxID=658196 RepID=A0A397SC22_9GLOM|nr:hypothetical protein C1645_742766 [Glomus cerebriforme]